MRKTALALLAALLLLIVNGPLTIVNAANVAPVISQVSGGGFRVVTITWANMAGTDTPLSTASAQCLEMTIQATGTFGTTTVTFQGSMDDTTYATLNDMAGTPGALSFTAAAYKRVQEKAAFVKPGLSGGSGTALKVVVLCLTP